MFSLRINCNQSSRCASVRRTPPLNLLIPLRPSSSTYSIAQCSVGHNHFVAENSDE
jgi:hypothetical protein